MSMQPHKTDKGITRKGIRIQLRDTKKFKRVTRRKVQRHYEN